MKTDSQIQEDVMAQLKWEPLLIANEIGVAAKHGVVTLAGTVDTFSKKKIYFIIYVNKIYSLFKSFR